MKNKFLWFSYACVLCVGYSRTTAQLTNMMGQTVPFYFGLTAALLLASLVLIYLPVKLLAGKSGHSAAGQEVYRSLPVSGWALLTAFLLAFLCIRLLGMPANMASFGQTDMVKELEGHGTGGLFLEDSYRALLEAGSFVWSGQAVPFYTNLILQALGAFFLYLGIYHLAGAWSASACLICLIVLPVFQNSVNMAEPQSLQFFVFAFLLWCCSLMIGKMVRSAKKDSFLIGDLAAGLACGMAAFCQMQLASLIILVLSIFASRSGKGKFRKAGIAFLSMAVVGFCTIFLLQTSLFGQSGEWMQDIRSVWQYFWMSGVTRTNDALLHSPSIADYWMTVPVYLLAFFAIFNRDETGCTNKAAWILPFAFIVLLEVVGNAPLQEQGMRFLYLGIFAGFGIDGMLCREEETIEEQDESVISQEDHQMGLFRQKKRVKDSAQVETMQPTDSRLEQKAQTADAAAQKDGLPEQEEHAEERKKPAPGEYLDNPLPVPKRHVKKEMAYGFEPEPEQMFFDIPISDQDDFDI